MFPPHYGFHKTILFLMKMKQATTVLIYKKIHSVNLSSLNKISTGKVINVVSSDLTQLMSGITIPGAFATPFVTIFTVVFLFYLFSWYSFFFVVAFVVSTMF